MAFQPLHHLRDIEFQTKQGKVRKVPFLPAKARANWLRDEQPTASIETHVVQATESWAIVHARVTLADGTVATGLAQESKQGFPKFVEKAESNAIARALELLGFGTTAAVQLAEREARPAPRTDGRPAPPARPAPRTEQPAPVVVMGDRAMTAEQAEQIAEYLDELNIEHRVADDRSLELYGVPIKQLSASRANDMLIALQRKSAAKRQSERAVAS